MKINTEIKKRFYKVIDTAIAERWNGVSDKKSFAEVAKIDKQKFYNLEAGRNITVEMIYGLCKYFGVNANYIITGKLPIKNTDESAWDKLHQIEKILKK